MVLFRRQLTYLQSDPAKTGRYLRRGAAPGAAEKFRTPPPSQGQRNSGSTLAWTWPNHQLLSASSGTYLVERLHASTCMYVSANHFLAGAPIHTCFV